VFFFLKLYSILNFDIVSLVPLDIGGSIVFALYFPIRFNTCRKSLIIYYYSYYFHRVVLLFVTIVLIFPFDHYTGVRYIVYRNTLGFYPTRTSRIPNNVRTYTVFEWGNRSIIKIVYCLIFVVNLFNIDSYVMCRIESRLVISYELGMQVD